MNLIRKSPSPLGFSEVLSVFAGNFYFISLYFSYRDYLYPVWSYLGFLYEPWAFDDFLWATVLTTVASLSLGLCARSRTFVVVVLLYIVVYVPTVVVSLSLPEPTNHDYYLVLVALCVGFFLVCFLSGKEFPRWRASFSVSWLAVSRCLIFAWIFCVAVLYGSYGGILGFSGFDDIHSQRLLSRESVSPVASYVQPFFINVVCAFFMAYGVLEKRWALFLLGVLGCVFVYMASAAKTLLALPFVYLFFGWLLSRKKVFAYFSIGLVFLVGALVLICLAFQNSSDLAFLISALLVHRTLAVPGLVVPEYYDLFVDKGFTWWSHVKGVSLFVSPPEFFARHPLWPNLGRIMGDVVYENYDLNNNGNLWAGDGVAAAGSFGVLVVSIFMGYFLRYMNRYSSSWSRGFVCLALLPYSLAISNVGFFTSLLTFGGLVWMLFFMFFKPGKGWGKSVTSNEF